MKSNLKKKGRASAEVVLSLSIAESVCLGYCACRKNSFYFLIILKMLDNLPRKKTEQDYTNGGIWCLVYLFLISGIVYFISSLF